MKLIKNKLNQVTFINKLYQFLFAALVLGIVLLINASMKLLPLHVSQIDVSQNSIYSLSDASESLISPLNENITIYLISEDGSRSAIMEKLLSRYEDASALIEVSYIDPNYYPTFTQQYTDIALNDNSVIVTNGRSHRVIDYSSMVHYEYDAVSGTATDLAFDAEGLITSAISYVVSDVSPIIYQLTGHGELPVDGFFLDSIKKSNISLKEIDLLTNTRIPDDAQCLLINSPSSDISESEANSIADYIDSGGNALIFINYSVDTPNLDHLLENIGIIRTHSVVLETNPSYYLQGYSAFILPAAYSLPSGFSFNDSTHILFPLAEGLLADSEHNAFSLLSTSDTSYLKSDYASGNTYKDEDDPSGSFALAVCSVGANGGRVLCFSTSQLLNSDVDSLVSGGNSSLLASSLSYLCDVNTTLSIPGKTFSAGRITVSTSQMLFWSAIVILVIPLIFAVIGTVIYLKRRRV